MSAGTAPPVMATGYWTLDRVAAALAPHADGNLPFGSTELHAVSTDTRPFRTRTRSSSSSIPPRRRSPIPSSPISVVKPSPFAATVTPIRDGRRRTACETASRMSW